MLHICYNKGPNLWLFAYFNQDSMASPAHFKYLFISSPCCATCGAKTAKLHQNSVLSQALPRVAKGEQSSGDETPFVARSSHGTDTEPTEAETGSERSLPSTEQQHHLFLRKYTHKFRVKCIIL